MSRVRGNSHARFLGGKAAVMPPTYPTKTIKVKFFADMSERVITWKVYDYTKQHHYYAFYNYMNGENNKIAIQSIKILNKIIENE